MSRASQRQRAIKLHATDAHVFLKELVPYALPRMTAAQIDQVQRVLDAYVINPEVMKEYEALRAKSIKHQSGNLIERDERIVHQADRLLQEDYIPIGENDKRVRIDFEKLLTDDALKPITDNPDELRYLATVKQTLVNHGVWVRFAQKAVRVPDDPSARRYDGRTFEGGLTLGPEGDFIPTDNGRLNRSILLGTTSLGAGYYRSVFQGNIQTALDNAVRRVRNQISDGSTLHSMVATDRRNAKFGVVGVSDTLGSADYPDEKIWEEPSRILNAALQMNVSGNVRQSSKAVVVAATATVIAAQKLEDYLSRTRTGAQRAVKVLHVIDFAGKIASIVLIIQAVATGLIRLLAGEAAATTAGGASGQRLLPPGETPPPYNPQAHYPTNYVGREAFDKTIQQANMTLVTDAGVSAIDRYSLATQAYRKHFMDEFRTWLMNNPAAPLEEKLAQLDKLNMTIGIPD